MTEKECDDTESASRNPPNSRRILRHSEKELEVAFKLVGLAMHAADRTSSDILMLTFLW